MSSTIETVQKIRRKMEDLTALHDKIQSEFLMASGWTYTCDVPGGLWFWQKKLTDGRVILTSQASALAIQEHIDGMFATEES